MLPQLADARTVPPLMKRISFAISFVGLLLAALLTGCAAHYERYLVSRPHVAESSVITAEGQIELNGAQIFVRPTNHVKIGKGSGWFPNSVKAVQPWFRGTPYFGGGFQTRFFFELYIEADRELAISPNRMVLTIANGQSKSPSGYLGPLPVWSTRNYSLALCKPDLNRQYEQLAEIRLKKGDSVCIALIYDFEPPLPSEQFWLNLNGVKMGNEWVAIPTIIFEQGVETGAHP